MIHEKIRQKISETKTHYATKTGLWLIADEVQALEEKMSAEPSIQHIIDNMKKLSDDERLEVMSYFCRFCGTCDPRCCCWNDE